ncbi:MAG: hypothetical protein PHQ66_02050 [Candidatus Nanoarchaeia archaeon]|nr:hypothetical protein [Candidatus Nanoarchaeia archaeon]MDD5357845.1 hypothetical protein [Candidatus Nanoarchaeia archaeon]MDD5588764.1 hypothetical protein [Candidatus Nanoarchaeia archaeon]
MSIYDENLQKILGKEIDYITSYNGTLIPLGKKMNLVDIGVKAMSSLKVKEKPKEPVFYHSIEEFKNVGMNNLPSRLWKLTQDFFSGKNTAAKTRKIIKSDSVLRENLENRKDFDEGNIYNTKIGDETEVDGIKISQIYLPEGSLLEYISRQEDFSGKRLSEIVDVKNKVFKIAGEICRKNKNLEGKTNEVVAVLFYDDFLRSYFLKEKILSQAPKKSKIEELSEASRISKNKIKYWTREVKKENIKEILNYKQENNLLTYRDLKNSNLIEQIKRELTGDKEIPYSHIAKKYGLKNSKVVSRIMRDTYSCEKSDLYEPIALMTA